MDIEQLSLRPFANNKIQHTHTHTHTHTQWVPLEAGDERKTDEREKITIYIVHTRPDAAHREFPQKLRDMNRKKK